MHRLHKVNLLSWMKYQFTVVQQVVFPDLTMYLAVGGTGT